MRASMQLNGSEMFPHQPPPIHDKKQKYDPLIAYGPLTLRKGFGAAADRYLLLVAPQSVIDVETVYAELYDKPAWALANGNPSSNEESMIRALGQITKCAVEESPMLVIMPTQYRADSAEFIHMSDVTGISDEEDLRSPCHFVVHLVKGNKLKFSAPTSVAYKYWMKALLQGLKKGSDAKTKRGERMTLLRSGKGIQDNRGSEMVLVDGVYRDAATARWVAEQPGLDFRSESPRSPPPPIATSPHPSSSASPLPPAASPVPETYRSTPTSGMSYPSGFYGLPVDPSQLHYMPYQYAYPVSMANNASSAASSRPVSYQSPIDPSRPMSYQSTHDSTSTAPNPRVSMDSRSMSRHSYTDSLHWASPRTSMDQHPQSFHTAQQSDQTSQKSYQTASPYISYPTSPISPGASQQLSYVAYPFPYPSYAYPQPAPVIPYMPPPSLAEMEEEHDETLKRPAASSMKTVESIRAPSVVASTNTNTKDDDEISNIPDFEFNQLDLSMGRPDADAASLAEPTPTAFASDLDADEGTLRRRLSVTTTSTVTPAKQQLAAEEEEPAEKLEDKASPAPPAAELPAMLRTKSSTPAMGSFLSSMVKRFSRTDSAFEGSRGATSPK